MRLKYFEKPCGVEYLKIDSFEVKVKDLLEVFSAANENDLHITEDNVDTFNILEELNVMDNLKDFEKTAMKVLYKKWNKDSDLMCTGSD